MNDILRDHTRLMAQILEVGLRELQTDLRTMSSEVVAIQWEQVQADIETLRRSMDDCLQAI